MGRINFDKSSEPQYVLIDLFVGYSGIPSFRPPRRANILPADSISFVPVKYLQNVKLFPR